LNHERRKILRRYKRTHEQRFLHDFPHAAPLAARRIKRIQY
jgi:hypothetical protein